MKKVIALTTTFALCAAFPALAADKDHKGMADEYFKKMDTNNDGSVSKEEHTAFAEKKFRDADTNNDGKLTVDEVRDHKMSEKKMHSGKSAPTASGDDDKVNNNSGVKANTTGTAPNVGE